MDKRPGCETRNLETSRVEQKSKLSVPFEKDSRNTRNNSKGSREFKNTVLSEGNSILKRHPTKWKKERKKPLLILYLTGDYYLKYVKTMNIKQNMIPSMN